MIERAWLELVQMPGVPNVIDRIIAAPGGQRAIVLLKAGSRGANGLALGLLRENYDDLIYLFDPLVPVTPVKITYVSLLKAPWEEA